MSRNYFPEQLFLPLQLSFPLQLSLPLQEFVDLASTFAADLSVLDFSELLAQPEINNVAAADAKTRPVTFVTLFMLRISSSILEFSYGSF